MESTLKSGNTHLVPAAPGGGITHAGSFSPAPAPPGPAPSTLSQVNTLLRGRYRLAVVLGVIGLVVGVGAGWRFAPPATYRSTGLIRIAPILPRVLYTNEQNSMMPMFDAFVATQATLLRSQRVVDLAMQGEAWKSTGRGTADEAVRDFMVSLSVTQNPGSQTVQVGVTDPSSDVAMRMVKAVIDAYNSIYGEQDARNEARRLEILEQRRTNLNNELKGLNDRILLIADEFGTDGLEKAYDFKLSELQKIESELTGVQREIAREGRDAGGAEPPPTPVDELTPEQIAVYNPQMRAYLQERSLIEDDIARQSAKLGKGHREIERLANSLGVVEQRIEECRTAFLAEGPPPTALDQSPQDLARREQDLKALHDKAREVTLDIGKKQLQIKSLKGTAKGIEEQLEETRFRIESLNVESSVSGRIEVLSSGDRPVSPHKDQRLRTAALGGIAGVIAAIGLVVFLGYMDQRLRAPEDASRDLGSLKVLGVLPELPAGVTGGEEGADAASHAVHETRVLLQLEADRHRHRVFAVTSPAPRDGKTGLCFALGASFAATGAKTLLVDCDLATGGLTSQTHALIRLKLGRILLERGVVTEDQLEQSLGTSRLSGRRLGDTLVDLGYLAPEQLSEVLAAQESSRLGLIEALAGEPIEACITHTHVADLSILPLGAAGPELSKRISSTRLQQLLDQLKGEYDLILIDTGRIPGSFEASLAAAAADAVVLVVSRGARREWLQQSLKRLHEVGATVIGVVFNKTSRRDFLRHAASGGGDGRDPRNGDGDRGSTGPAQEPRFNPIARAVTGALPSNGNRHNPVAGDRHG